MNKDKINRLIAENKRLRDENKRLKNQNYAEFYGIYDSSRKISENKDEMRRVSMGKEVPS